MGKSEACDHYEVDPQGAEFGVCRCGAPKSAHQAKEEDHAAAALRALKEKSAAHAGVAKGEGKACDAFKTDVASTKGFGYCVCGFHRDDHGAKKNKGRRGRKTAMRSNRGGSSKEIQQESIAIGSGGPFAQSAARALLDNTDLSAEDIVKKGLTIAGDICIYTNHNHTIESLEAEQ